MTTTQSIATGDRIYATEIIDYYDFKINTGAEGAVLRVTDSDAVELLIEWDAGVQGMVDSGSVALVENPCNGTALCPVHVDKRMAHSRR